MRSMLMSMREWGLRVLGIVTSLSVVRNLTLLRRVLRDLQGLNAKMRGLPHTTQNTDPAAQQPIQRSIDILSDIETELRALSVHCDYLLAQAVDERARLIGTLDHLVELHEQAIRNQVVVMNQLLEDAQARHTQTGLSAIEPRADDDRGPAEQP